MHLSKVEEHLGTLLDPESPGSDSTHSNVRAALTQLSELQIEASPLLVAEDVLAIEVNPMTDEPGTPTAFGLLFVRRLFLQTSEDDSTSAVEVGIEFEIPEEIGLLHETPDELQVELAPTPDADLPSVLAQFDATPAGRVLSERDFAADVFLQDHDEILD